MQVGADMEAFLSSDNAQRLCVEGVGTTDGLVQNAGDKGLGLIWSLQRTISEPSVSTSATLLFVPPHLDPRPHQRTELAIDREDAVELPVWVRCDHLTTDITYHSCLPYPNVCLAVDVWVRGELEGDGSVLVESAGIEAEVLTEGGEKEVGLVGGGARSVRHPGRGVTALLVEFDCQGPFECSYSEVV